MKIDKNSYGTVALVLFLCIVCVTILFLFVDSLWINVMVSAFCLAVALWQIHFHMVPVRPVAGSDTVVGAVADGRIVINQVAFESEYLKRDCRMVSVYMDFWDYHANFWPVTGDVTYYKYHPGKHFLAFKPKSSEENEHTTVAIRNAEGQEIVFRQIAGGFARRIVCYAREGMKVKAGEQCGIIKFGSRIDYFLPLDCDVRVTLEDIVISSGSEIAYL